MRARIRDFIESKDGWIFAVADYHHPRGIRSLLRYIPHPQGEREAGGRRFRKLDFDPSFDFLRRERPDYIEDLHVVPVEDVSRRYDPVERLSDVAKADSRLGRITVLLEDGGIERRSMGITGSMLIGLQGPTSDIDFVAYGKAWFCARDIIRQAKANGLIEELNDSMWRKIYAKRRPEVSFSEFVLHERRKGNRGVIDGTYFDLLFTREWDQIGGSPRSPGRPVGRAKVVGEVVDAEYAFDSPSILKLDGDVEEIACFSHTYAGQALPGEKVEAVGVLEETASGLSLIVGTTREARGEWIRSLSLLGLDSPAGLSVFE
ncbi:MAG: DNA polymerase subunit beta [Methanotrichaceae archaeon]|nr:DNA polymerase subunit beta [Methanotrichaceae archaeon]